jgi:hypothetical protein
VAVVAAWAYVGEEERGFRGKGEVVVAIFSLCYEMELMPEGCTRLRVT